MDEARIFDSLEELRSNFVVVGERAGQRFVDCYGGGRGIGSGMEGY